MISMNNRDNKVDKTTTPRQNKQSATDTAIKPRRQYRPYRRITPETISKFKALKALHGNGTQAVRELEPDITDASRRAWLLSSKANELNASEYVEKKVEQIALQAVERLQELVQSEDEHIATKNVHYTLDRQGGKAVQRSENKTITLNIDAILG